MIMTGLHWYSPTSLEEALRLLAELPDSRIMAGGTDLLVDLKSELISVKNCVSLQKIQGIGAIEEDRTGMRIGALATPHDIAAHPLIRHHIPSLAEAAESMASVQIRSMATIGGNIASAVPSADLPPSLIAAGATVRLVCSGNQRDIPLEAFISGPRNTTCGPAEILTLVNIPFRTPGTGCAYRKFTLREANALAVASAAVRLTIKEGIIERAGIVLGAVAPTPYSASNTAKILVGKRPSAGLFEQAGERAMAECRPISDIRGSEEFRRELVRVLSARALEAASERALKSAV